MKIILISDLHLTSAQPIGRKDNVLKTGLAKLKFVLDYAADNDVSFIFQAGDFCDKARDWNLLLQLYDTIQLGKQNTMIFTIQGQHDYYYRSKSELTATTMGILQRARLTYMLTTPIGITGNNDWMVSPMHWGDKMPTPIRGVKNILVAHAPISPVAVYPGQEVTTDKQLERLLKKWDVVLLGDIHRHFRKSFKDRHIVNTGPMMRLESTEYNMDHHPCFYVFRTSRPQYIERVVIPHQPAEEVLHYSESAKQTEVPIHNLSQSLVEKFKDNPNKARIRDILKDTKGVSRSVKKIIINAWTQATK